MNRVILIFCLLLMSLGVAGDALWQWWSRPFAGQRQLILQVDKGTTLSAVSEQLERGDALRCSELWRQIVRLKGQATQIKRGEYLFEAGLSPGEILQRLVDGDVIQYEVTLPEGITLRQALELLRSQPRLGATLTGVDDPRLLALAAPRNSAEGLFFPDTYRFSRGDTDLGILRRAQLKMEQVLLREWPLRKEKLPLATPYEALILASIIEKETGLASERERIAGVFVRRLQRRMRLQADPTVIYGLGDAFTGNLRRSHLEDASNPYNSYRHFGLPPTPIALAGKAALRAALHPGAGNELYFVARGDGSHEFSAIMEQHESAVRRYQRKRTGNYHSAPAGQIR